VVDICIWHVSSSGAGEHCEQRGKLGNGQVLGVVALVPGA
jgi:hypothetical protein